MIGRLVEDAIFLSRMAYFYYKAPDEIQNVTSVGFVRQETNLDFKQRVKYAYKRASGLPNTPV